MMASFMIGCMLLAWGKEFAPITKVTVTNSDGSILKVLQSEAELQAFVKGWASKTKTDPHPKVSLPGAAGADSKTLRLTILRQEKNEVWLYDPTGWVQILSKAKVPIFRIESVEEFNKALGVL